MAQVTGGISLPCSTNCRGLALGNQCKWGNCRLLLDVKSAEFQKALPLEVDAFKTWQAECTERGKAGLWTSWLPKCVEVFRRLLPIFINGNSDAYYSSIATLQVCW